MIVKMRTFVLMVLALAILTAAQKARDWQTGTLLDSQRSQYQSGKIQTLVIEGADYVYTVQEDTGRPHLSPAPPRLTNLTVNAQIKYAVEKQTLYLIDDDGKERKMEIVKRALKLKR